MGIFKLNGIDYMGGGGGGDSGMELTYDEYLALPEEEKTNGTTYYVKDINGVGKDQFQPVICSSEEREIGVFSDGKPLYERTFTKTLASTPDADSASFLVASNIDYIDTLVHMWGAVSKTNGTAWSGSTGLILADGWKYSFHINPSNQLVVWTSESITAYREIAGGKVTITIRYTKTSDVAGSGTWTPQGVPAAHYSTDEQVVGTWIDGKTLYEKTIEWTGTLNNNSNILIDTSITYENIDYFSCINSMFMLSTYSNKYGASVMGKNLDVTCAVGGIYVENFIGFTINKIIITIRYTKTTS